MVQGPLLDFGRNPILFPCAWIYRQGVLTPWSRNRRPVLEGDNWWRGHAAAFLKYVNLPPEVLRQGRVSQIKREAAYFIVVLHHVKTVVIAVRGTETPEDLITDGLCRECSLSVDDLDGLINNDHLSPEVRQRVLSSFPHYGHSGIVESARELFMQIDGQPSKTEGLPSENAGFLSSLLGPGCECQGYKIRIVGHSLGGAVGAVLGLRLYRRYPDLHVYSYGTLPCVDKIVAEACSDFVTSIVYNDEFSARLSVNSIIRLRAAAMTALSDSSSADSAMIYKLARRILHANKPQESRENRFIPALPCQSAGIVLENSNQRYRRKHVTYTVKGIGEHDQEFLSRDSSSLIDDNGAETLEDDAVDVSSQQILDLANATNSSNMACFSGSDDLISLEDRSSLDHTTSSIQVSIGETPEMFLPGLIIHVVPERQSILPLWTSWKVQDRKHGYRAFIANRENFKDILVTPYMFLDHLPWRCHYAIQRVLETRRAEGRLNADLVNREHIV
uniref:Sn1-specific diacylglycerol lipase alpha n=1 Tax=Anthurium amnicola TaxID=1678845 RepID=A0A1D1YGF4_9ARAE